MSVLSRASTSSMLEDGSSRGMLGCEVVGNCMAIRQAWSSAYTCFGLHAAHCETELMTAGRDQQQLSSNGQHWHCNTSSGAAHLLVGRLEAQEDVSDQRVHAHEVHIRTIPAIELVRPAQSCSAFLSDSVSDSVSVTCVAVHAIHSSWGADSTKHTPEGFDGFAISHKRMCHACLRSACNIQGRQGMQTAYGH